VNLFLLKLVLTPTLIGAASLAGRRWGHAVSGWLVALPLTTGPIVFLLALSHGPAFAADTAVGILTGGFSLAAFVLVYGRFAPHMRWLPTLASATVTFGLMTSLLQSVTLPVVPLWLAVVASFLLVLWLLPTRAVSAPVPETLPGRWDIPLRMLIATVFVFLITGLAPALGPHLAGLISPFPLFTATLAAFAQHQHGPLAAIKVLRGLLMGLFSYASFMLTLALLLVPLGIARAFALAILVTAIFQAASLWLLQNGRA
jgi:hypothetical protein